MGVQMEDNLRGGKASLGFLAPPLPIVSQMNALDLIEVVSNASRARPKAFATQL